MTLKERARTWLGISPPLSAAERLAACITPVPRLESDGRINGCFVLLDKLAEAVPPEISDNPAAVSAWLDRTLEELYQIWQREQP